MIADQNRIKFKIKSLNVQFVGKNPVSYLRIAYVPVKLEDIATKLALLQELLPLEPVEASFDAMRRIYNKMGTFTEGQCMLLL